MADLNNPTDALNRGRQLLTFLGTFWNTMYADSGVVEEYVNAKNQAELQSHRDLMELVACASRFTVPVFHKSNWSVLTLKKSAQLSGHLLAHGEGAVFGNDPKNMGNTYLYGVSPDRTSDYAAPGKLKNVHVIVNRISEPSVTLIEGVDFITDGPTSAIRFRDDPFKNPLIPTRPVFDAKGAVVDTELSLWLFMGEYDWNIIYEQFGYALDLYLQSSENYRNLLNAVWDAILQGPTSASLELVLSSMAGVELSSEPSETVVDVVSEPDRKLVITDRRVYKFNRDANVLVVVGQTLPAGSKLVDAFTVYLPYRDLLPAVDVPSITLGPEMLVGPFRGGLTFANQAQPLLVTTDALGRTRVEFTITGDPADVRLFWDTVHLNGTTTGALSLAKMLDLRAPPVQVTEPTANNLPTTVNPVDFLAKNVLRNNALVVVFNEAAFGPDALGIKDLKPLRQTLPPQAAVFILTR